MLSRIRPGETDPICVLHPAALRVTILNWEVNWPILALYQLKTKLFIYVQIFEIRIRTQYVVLTRKRIRRRKKHQIHFFFLATNQWNIHVLWHGSKLESISIYPLNTKHIFSSWFLFHFTCKIFVKSHNYIYYADEIFWNMLYNIVSVATDGKEIDKMGQKNVCGFFRMLRRMIRGENFLPLYSQVFGLQFQTTAE